MDRVFVYKHLLATEDHIEENLEAPMSIDEENFLEGLLAYVRYLRDEIMPEEVNPRYHCIAKHLSAVAMGLSEIAKATEDNLDMAHSETARSTLVEVLEKLWGRKIYTCERCGVKEADEPDGIQTEDRGSVTETIDDGLSRNGIQGSGDYREPGLSSVEADGIAGKEIGRTDAAAKKLAKHFGRPADWDTSR